MRILIIGCGYLGLRAAALWREARHDVAALTRSPDRAGQLRGLGIAPHLGNVLDRDSLARLPPADVCLHAVGYDRRSGEDKRAVYVDGLRSVLAELGPRAGRFLHVSSTSVYGQDAGELVNEDSPTAPTTDGGRICLEAERLVLDDSRLPATVLRLSGIYGPGRLIGRIDQFHQRQPIGGNPRAWLNLVHVDDAAAAVVQLAEGPQPAPLYLLSDQRPLPREEFYRALAKLAGAPPPVFSNEGEEGLNKRCDSSRIRRELGLTLRYPTIDEGLPHALGDAGGQRSAIGGQQQPRGMA